MLSIEQVVKKLADRNLKRVASATGLSYTAVWKVMQGARPHIQYETVKKLSDYIEEQERGE